MKIQQLPSCKISFQGMVLSRRIGAAAPMERKRVEWMPVLKLCVGRDDNKNWECWLYCPRSCSSMQCLRYGLLSARRVKDIITRSLSWWIPFGCGMQSSQWRAMRLMSCMRNWTKRKRDGNWTKRKRDGIPQQDSIQFHGAQSFMKSLRLLNYSSFFFFSFFFFFLKNLCYPYFVCFVCKSRLLVPDLNQINPVDTIPPCLCKVHFNIIFSSASVLLVAG
jgi:hypothetical protein